MISRCISIFTAAVIVMTPPASHADEAGDAERLFSNALQTIEDAAPLGIAARAEAHVAADRALTELLGKYPATEIGQSLAARQPVGAKVGAQGPLTFPAFALSWRPCPSPPAPDAACW